MRKKLEKPVKLLNDADVQGLAVIEGKGLELVCTLGTGFGTAWFRDGELMPHMDLAHLAVHKKDDFDVYVGDKTRRKIGNSHWNRRVKKLIGVLETVFAYDQLYLGGGNSRLRQVQLPRNVTIVSNDAGMEGGAFAWSRMPEVTARLNAAIEPKDTRGLVSALSEPIDRRVSIPLDRSPFAFRSFPWGAKLRKAWMMPPVSGNTALFLDIDGTLLDLARTPDRGEGAARPAQALEQLARRLSGALSLLSAAVRWTASTGCLRRFSRPPSAPMAARCAAWTAGRRAASRCRIRCAQVFAGLGEETFPALLLEDKKCALALHYRLAPEARPVLTSAMEKHARLFEAEKVHILHGKSVIEARPAGRGQGRGGARRWSSRNRFAGRAILFGGDDATDLDVFRILPELGGRGFSVGRQFPGAEHVFELPRAVRQWLTRTAETGVR